jgi:hypothetical protein
MERKQSEGEGKERERKGDGEVIGVDERRRVICLMIKI